MRKYFKVFKVSLTRAAAPLYERVRPALLCYHIITAGNYSLLAIQTREVRQTTAGEKYMDAKQLILEAGEALDAARTILSEIIDATDSPDDVRQAARRDMEMLNAIRE